MTTEIRPSPTALSQIIRDAAGASWTVTGRYLLFRGVLARLWRDGLITEQQIRMAAHAEAESHERRSRDPRTLIVEQCPCRIAGLCQGPAVLSCLGCGQLFCEACWGAHIEREVRAVVMALRNWRGR